MTYIPHGSFEGAPQISTFSMSGNIIPSEWYQTIVTKSGTPDHTAITVFSEIIYWYRPNKEGRAKFRGDAWQSSYSHFETKFGYYHEKVRRSFVRLEELGLVAREFRAVEHYGQKYPNRLFIHLTNKAFELISKSSKTLKKESFSEEKNNIFSKFVETSPQIIGDYIKDTKNISNNRSMNLGSEDPKSQSNFLEKNNLLQSQTCGVHSSRFETSDLQQSLGVGLEKDLKKSFKRSFKIENNSLKPKIPKRLSDFYPLSDKDCALLQIKSGRNFNLNAMNEILLSMSKRLTDREFMSKGSFLNYMSKALSSEIRQAEKINNNNFRIRSNRSKEDLDLLEKDGYLNKIEKDSDMSEISRLRKKLAGCFETKKAYEIIKNLKTVYNSNPNSKKVMIEFSHHIDLSYFDKEIIQKEAVGIYNISGDVGIENIELLVPDKGFSESINKRKYNVSNGLSITSDTCLNQKVATKLPDNIWGRIRKNLIKELGEGIDKSWFSILKAKIDESNKQIELRAPTKFMKDWIEVNYRHKLLNSAKYYGFSFTEEILFDSQ